MVGEFIKRLGPIRNPVLATGILGSSIIFSFSSSLARDPVTQVHGIMMHYCAILLIFMTVLFYCYAMLRLPSSAREQRFEEDSAKIVEEHRKKKSLSGGKGKQKDE